MDKANTSFIEKFAERILTVAAKVFPAQKGARAFALALGVFFAGVIFLLRTAQQTWRQSKYIRQIGPPLPIKTDLETRRNEVKQAWTIAVKKERQTAIRAALTKFRTARTAALHFPSKR